LTYSLATFLLPITTAFDVETAIKGVTFTWGTRPEYRGTDGSPGDGGGGLDGATNTPEPATLALFGLALAAGATQLRRRNKK
jgi:hypothetical protein